MQFRSRLRWELRDMEKIVKGMMKGWRLLKEGKGCSLSFRRKAWFPHLYSVQHKYNTQSSLELSLGSNTDLGMWRSR